MGFPQTLKTKLKRLGRLEKFFAIALLLYIILRLLFPGGPLAPLLALLLTVSGIWLAIRTARAAIRTAIWRLRNRLLVTYIFIAVIPVLLIITLGAMGAYALASQIAVYLATSELDRKVAGMQTATDALMRTEPPLRKDVMRRLGEIYQDRYPGMVMLIQDRSSLIRWPEAADVNPPAKDWGDTNGAVLRDGHYYAWSHLVKNGVEITAAVPLTRRFLSEMVPGLGEVYFLQISPNDRSRTVVSDKGLNVSVTREQSPVRVQVEQQHVDLRPAWREAPSAAMPAPVNRFDIDVQWPSVMPVSAWLEAGRNHLALLLVRTRFSAILGIISSRKVDQLQGLLPVLLLVVATLFLIVEIVSIVIGTSLTRTVTGAVHSLYEGTQKVMQGDFTHRIKVSGKDQVAGLGTSFNTMTENLERLLAVAKEKERLQAELEIAREVQEQLYPKTAPAVRTLRLTALCQPARMVSGDYYDFQRLHENKLAIAIGDVAGKGISAALLMATIHSAVRAYSLEAFPSHGIPQAVGAQVGSSGGNLPLARGEFSPALLVGLLNQQLYRSTPAEKYATLFLSNYDGNSRRLTFTNAGHLPPVLIGMDGSVRRLDCGGTVVGLFDGLSFEESSIELHQGDIFLAYSDGVTEPENDFGEFGEERLVDLVRDHRRESLPRITEIVTAAVDDWIGGREQPDDITLVLARAR